jgi:hypothetical protein
MEQDLKDNGWSVSNGPPGFIDKNGIWKALKPQDGFGSPPPGKDDKTLLMWIRKIFQDIQAGRIREDGME